MTKQNIVKALSVQALSGDPIGGLSIANLEKAIYVLESQMESTLQREDPRFLKFYSQNPQALVDKGAGCPLGMLTIAINANDFTSVINLFIANCKQDPRYQADLLLTQKPLPIVEHPTPIPVEPSAPALPVTPQAPSMATPQKPAPTLRGRIRETAALFVQALLTTFRSILKKKRAVQRHPTR